MSEANSANSGLAAQVAWQTESVLPKLGSLEIGGTGWHGLAYSQCVSPRKRVGQSAPLVRHQTCVSVGIGKPKEAVEIMTREQPSTNGPKLGDKRTTRNIY